jgi:lipoprotein signal peptidase
MITKQTFIKYSFIFLSVIFILLLLVFFRTVPEEWYIYIMILTLILAGVYIYFRVYFVVQNKKRSQGG